MKLTRLLVLLAPGTDRRFGLGLLRPSAEVGEVNTGV